MSQSLSEAAKVKNREIAKMYIWNILENIDETTEKVLTVRSSNAWDKFSSAGENDLSSLQDALLT